MPKKNPTDPYATHLPVLEGLKPKPKKVLEFGYGNHSTKAFLAMKSVTKLVTVEADATWRANAEKIKDKRLEVVEAFDGDLTDFDLVFIDNGQNPHERMDTMVRVLGQPHPKVVIHDIDYQPYLDTLKAYTSKYGLHTALVPNTAIVEAT